MSPRKSQEIPASPGVYQIRCLQNRKIYVGSAVNLRARWIVHRRLLIMKQHHNPHLQSRNGLDFPSMHRLWKGQSKLKSYKGRRILPGSWPRKCAHDRCGARQDRLPSRVDARARQEKSPSFGTSGYIAPGGAHVRITNLSALCRACGLSVVHMHQLKNGERPSHKGWTWKHDADQAFE